MLKRYTASIDTTITNAYQLNLRTRGTGANMGASDVLETFSIYGRQSASSSASPASQELSRILIKFPVDKISSDRTAGVVPDSGSVNFFLKLFNAEHSRTVPRDYKIVVYPISQSWQEGTGLDMEGYKDLTKGNPGSNWLSASNTSGWTSVGGDYLKSNASLISEQTFESGLENLEVDISYLVESWLTGSTTNHGVGIFLSSSFEAYFSNSAGASDSGSVINNTAGARKSYYTKRFFARGTQYFFRRPVIEARWDSARRDDRGEFYFSSSLAPAADNLNTLYLYNFIRGRLTNIPSVGTGTILVSLYSGSADNTGPSGSKQTLFNGQVNITGGHVSTGIYSCSIGIQSSSIKTLYDVWHKGGVEFSTGSISPMLFKTSPTTKEPVYYINITNLANTYRSDETARMNLYVRHKNWNPTIYNVASVNPETTNIHSASYRVIRTLDNQEVISYGTGSKFHTGLSYDVSGNYFDFDMSLLEPGYEYKFKFSFYDSRMNTWKEQRQEFNFRVEK